MTFDFETLFKLKGLNANKLKEPLKCGYATAWRKVKDPKLFTVGDLLNMNACGAVSLQELFEAINEMKGSRKR